MPVQPICWTVKRNCSASPAQLAAVLASMVGLSFVFGVAFAIHGMWLILPFVGLELVALAVAFFCYGRRAADYERITVTPETVKVERVEGARTSQWQFPAAWVKVELEQSGAGWMQRICVVIASHGERVEVGRHLPPGRREALAEEVAAALRGVAAA